MLRLSFLHMSTPCKSLLLLVSMLLLSLAVAPVLASSAVAPPTPTPTQPASFGQSLGSYDGQTIHDNGPWSYVSGTDSGYGTEWQCVEFVQRYFAVKWGFPTHWDAKYAYQMYNNTPAHTTAYPNGSSMPPVPGDILVFNKDGDWPDGHVALVTQVTSSQITFAQQNVQGRPTAALPINSRNSIDSQGRYPPVRGWIHAAQNMYKSGATQQSPTAIAVAQPTPDFSGPKTSGSSAQLSTEAPSPVKPGGEWIGPKNGTAISTSTIQFSAHAYPSHTGDPAIDRVVFTMWWPALGPKSGPWTPACTASRPQQGDIFSCVADLGVRGVPPGTVSVSFDVYDAKGNRSLSPNREHTITFESPTSVTLYEPPQRWSREAQGSCLDISLIVSRPGAWRCMEGDEIYDPCFTIPGGGTGAVLCDIAPPANNPGVKLDLTAPLPTPGSSGQPQPFIMQLSDGTVCDFTEGTPFFVPSFKAFVRDACGTWVSTQPRTIWALIAVQQNRVWTANKVLLASNGVNGFSILRSIPVTIVRAWE